MILLPAYIMPHRIAKLKASILTSVIFLPGFQACKPSVKSCRILRNSGKFVIAYAIGYTQKSYYLASVADKVYLYPEGEVYLKGLSAQIMFYKKALEKLGIQVQVFRHGRFKSFVEPYILDKMSPDNKLQIRGLISSIWGDLLGDIADSRHLTVGDINTMTDSLSISSGREALKYKLVDSLLYPDQVKAQLKNMNLAHGDAMDKENYFVGLDEYRKSFNNYKVSSRKIAIVYATAKFLWAKVMISPLAQTGFQRLSGMPASTLKLRPSYCGLTLPAEME